MSGKKGMQRYPEAFKRKIIKEYENGAGLRELSRKYSVSKYSIGSWYKNKNKSSISKTKNTKTPEERIKQLEQEVALLRSFLQIVGRM